MCVLSIKVPIRKKSGNLFNDPRFIGKLKKKIGKSTNLLTRLKFVEVHLKSKLFSDSDIIIIGAPETLGFVNVDIFERAYTRTIKNIFPFFKNIFLQFPICLIFSVSHNMSQS